MRYHYATQHQCDSCGATALVPDLPDLRKLESDPRPNGWGLPVGTQFVDYSHNNGGRLCINDLCPVCMNLPLFQVIENVKKRYENYV